MSFKRNITNSSLRSIINDEIDDAFIEGKKRIKLAETEDTDYPLVVGDSYFNLNVDSLNHKVEFIINNDVRLSIDDTKTTIPLLDLGPGSTDYTGTFTGPLTGDVTGNVLGNVQGNVVGNVSGDLTGNSYGVHTGDSYGTHYGGVTGSLLGNSQGSHTGPVVGNVTGNLSGNVVGGTVSGTTGTFSSNLTTSGILSADSVSANIVNLSGDITCANVNTGTVNGDLFGDVNATTVSTVTVNTSNVYASNDVVADNRIVGSDLIGTNLSLNDINFPIGETLVSNAIAGPGLRQILTRKHFNGRTVEVSNEANVDSPYAATTLYDAVEKMKLIAPTGDNPGLIYIHPGAYEESKQIVIDGDIYFAIAGPPQYSVAVFTLTTSLPPGSAWIDIQVPLIELSYFLLNANGNADYCLKGNAASVGDSGLSIDMLQIWFQGARIALYWLDGSTAYTFSNVFSISETTLVYGELLTNGASLYKYSSTLYPDAASTLLPTYYIHATNSYVNYSGDTSFGTPNSTFIYLDGSELDLTNLIIDGFGLGISAINSSTVKTSSCVFKTNGVDISFDSTSLWTSNGDVINISKIPLSTMNVTNSQLFSNVRDLNSRGSHIIGRTVIGNVAASSTNLFFGQGASNVLDMVIYRFNSNTNTYTDLTDSLLESTASNTDLFFNSNGTYYLMVGGGYKFGAIAINIVTAAASTQVSVWEYYNGTTWVSFNIMATSFSKPFTPYTNTPLRNTGLILVRFDVTLLQGTNWPLSSFNSVTKYWMRIRITVNINPRPIANYIQMYHSSTVSDETGTIRHLGLSRTLSVIPFDTASIKGSGGNQDIYFSDTFVITRVQNQLTGAGNFSGAFVMPQDFDSSSPLIIRIAYVSQSSLAAQIPWNFVMRYGLFTPGTQIYINTTQAPASVSFETSFNFDLTPDSVNGQFLKVIDLPFIYLPTTVPYTTTGSTNNFFGFRIEKLNSGNTAVFTLVNITFLYYSFKTTGVYVE